MNKKRVTLAIAMSLTMHYGKMHPTPEGSPAIPDQVIQELKKSPLDAARKLTDQAMVKKLTDLAQANRSAYEKLAKEYYIKINEEHPFFTNNTDKDLLYSVEFSIKELINYNKIPKISTVRKTNPKREEATLALKGLRISSLEGLNEVPDIDKASTIDLSNNKLTKLAANSIKDLPYVQTIDLSHNPISLLEDDVFINTPQLQTVLLQDHALESLEANPFKSLKNKLALFDLESFSSNAFDPLNWFESQSKFRIKTIKQDALKSLAGSVQRLNLKGSALSTQDIDFITSLQSEMSVDF